MFSSDNLSYVLRAISSALQAPVMLVLILMILITIFMTGTLLVELFTSRLKLKADLPALTDQLKAHQGDLAGTIRDSGLLERQKEALLEVISHPDLTPAMRESLAAELLYEEKERYEGIVKVTDVISKLGPMFGLMGTLIPLGPGIIALGRGDTLTLSQSLLIAFDTTVAGLAAAAVCFVISAIRRKWYGKYMSGLEMCMECMVELESGNPSEETRMENRGVEFSVQRSPDSTGAGKQDAYIRAGSESGESLFGKEQGYDFSGKGRERR